MKKTLIIIITIILIVALGIAIYFIKFNNHENIPGNNNPENTIVVLEQEYNTSDYQVSKLEIDSQNKTIRLYINKISERDISYLRFKIRLYDENDKLIDNLSINYDDKMINEKGYIESTYENDLSKVKFYSFDTDTKLYHDYA